MFQAPVLAERIRDDRSPAKEWTMKQCLAIKGVKSSITAMVYVAASASTSHTKTDYLQAFKMIVIAFATRANTSPLSTEPLAEGLVLQIQTA